MPLARLTPADVESVGSRIHAKNVETLREIDRLYSEGRFGEAGTEEARGEALRRFKGRALNSMDYISRLARVEGKVYTFQEGDIAEAFQHRFANPGVYPFLTLRMGRAGLGGFCLQYDYSEGYRGSYDLFAEKVTLTSEEVRLDDARTLMLKFVYPSGLHSTLELLYESSYCGQVFYREIVDRGDSLELITVESMEGCFVRKAGVHKVSGFAFWREIGSKAVGARVGAMAYLPAIHLRLPFFLPDIGLQDLREFDLPQPVWEQSFLRRTDRWPEWLPMRGSGGIANWSAEGPPPEILDTLFPDL